MKKLLLNSLLVTLLIAMSMVIVISAPATLAVEKVSTAVAEATVAYEQAQFLLNTEGKVCGLTFEETKEKMPSIGIKNTAPEIRGFSADNGKLVRCKATHEAKLDESELLAEGSSSISINKVEVIDQSKLDELGIEITASAIVDATVRMVGDKAYHRFVTADKGATEVARLYFPSENASSKRYISVRYADWDGDGDYELCLRAGTRRSAKKATSSNEGSGDSGTSGSDGGNTNNGGNSNNGGGSSSNEPNPHYREWADSDSSTSSGGGEPDPHFRGY